MVCNLISDNFTWCPSKSSWLFSNFQWWSVFLERYNKKSELAEKRVRFESQSRTIAFHGLAEAPSNLNILHVMSWLKFLQTWNLWYQYLRTSSAYAQETTVTPSKKKGYAIFSQQYQNHRLVNGHFCHVNFLAANGYDDCTSCMWKLYINIRLVLKIICSSSLKTNNKVASVHYLESQLQATNYNDPFVELKCKISCSDNIFSFIILKVWVILYILLKEIFYI